MTPPTAVTTTAATSSKPAFEWPVECSPTGTAMSPSRFSSAVTAGEVCTQPWRWTHAYIPECDAATAAAWEDHEAFLSTQVFGYGSDAPSSEFHTESFSGDSSFPQDGQAYFVGADGVPRRHNLHTELGGFLSYFDFESVTGVYAAGASDDAAQSTAGYGSRMKRLFIGQLPPELPARCLRWLIRTIAGVEALGVQHCAFGCRLVGFHNTFDADRVKHMLHDRVLFDANGAWYARTDAELDRLRRYRQSLDHIPCFYLPRHMMTVRDQRQKASQARREQKRNGGADL